MKPIPADWHPFHRWGANWRARWAHYSEHGLHKHKDHFQLWQFFWANGMDPKRCTFECFRLWTGNKKEFFYQSGLYERYARDPELRKRYLRTGRVWDCDKGRPVLL